MIIDDLISKVNAKKCQKYVQRKTQSIRLQEFALQRCMFSSKMGCDSVGPLNDMCIGEDHSIRGVNAESRALTFDFSLWGRSVWPDAKEEGENVRIPF